jgi:hypothetical protein
MKKKLLATIIATVISSQSYADITVNPLAEITSKSMMNEMVMKVDARVKEVMELAKDPANWEEKNGRNFLRYKNYLYPMSPDNEPLFLPFVLGSSYEENVAYADRSAESMFDFVQSPWRLVNEQDGVFIFHDQFGFGYFDELNKCNVQYLASSRDRNLVTQSASDCLELDTKLVDAIGFVDELKVTNHLTGGFEAQIRFIQNQTSEPSGNSEKSQQKLVSLRETLLVVTPTIDAVDPKSIKVHIFKDGELLETRLLSNPHQMMKTDRTVKDDRPDVQLSKRSYSTILPWNWVEKGLSLTFSTYDGREGELAENVIEFGAPIHVDFPMIRIGMLTDPPGAKQLENQMANYGAELFQRFPFASMTISPYLPVKLDKIVTANGEVEEQYSYFEKPDVYSGDLREQITKSLIQTGINNANFGVTSTAGTAQWHPGNYPAVVIGHSVGRYLDKDGEIKNVTHGLSGGNGMVLLVDAVNNEVTHEIGHAFSLWHLGDPYRYHNMQTGWGYDAYRGMMSDNLWWDNKGGDEFNYQGIVGFGKDPMAGGNFESRGNSYPLFTGYTSRVMQDYLTGHDMLDLDSVSGYSHWDTEQQVLLPVAETTKPKPVLRDVDVMTMVGYYDPKNSNMSYIYPPLYGSAGQVYDFPEVEVGQCWATVTYANGREQLIGLEGQRFDANSNKFHINLERAANPKKMTVSCPEKGLQELVEEELLASFDQTRFYNWDEHYASGGTVGDIYFSPRMGRTELFRLNKQRYWYFPGYGESNVDWTFVGYIDELVEQYVAEHNPDFDTLGKVILTSQIFESNHEYPARAVTFGKGQGYVQGVEDTPTFAAHKSFANIQLATFADFDRYLLSIGQYTLFGSTPKIYDGLSKSPNIGAMHVFSNPITGTRDYFLKKSMDAKAMPINQASNADWKYLGTAEDYVNFTINPILLDRQPGDNEARIMAYYGVDKLLTWEQRLTTTGQRYTVFVNTLVDGTNEYLMQKMPAKGGAFPTNQTSNADWYYLTSDIALAEQFQAWQNIAVFEDDLLQWYAQDALGDWGENGQKGTIGDVFDYDKNGGRHYYQLKVTNYGYFPWPDSEKDPSNHQWKYLGAY